MSRHLIIGILVVIAILCVIAMRCVPAAESMIVTHRQYIRAVDPLALRPLVNPLIGIAPINPIADVSGFSGI